jgi:hypothetical protein
VAWLTALKTNASANVPDSEMLTSDVSQGTTDLARGNPSSATSHPNSRKCFTPCMTELVHIAANATQRA